jgi:hypothetical protein
MIREGVLRLAQIGIKTKRINVRTVTNYKRNEIGFRQVRQVLCFSFIRRACSDSAW